MGDGTQTIYLVSKGFQHRFWQAVKQGAEEAGKEYNYKVEFVGPENEQAVTQQLDQLRTALQSAPAAIGFAALDSGAAGPVLAEIQAANIPIIAFDSGVDSDIPLTTVSTDNKAAAAEAAKNMVELAGRHRHRRHGLPRPDVGHRQAALRGLPGVHGRQRARHQGASAAVRG